ncbi:Alkaline_phosphatase [Hexamita inflata]|uniref:Alkaline phosphatase n=1 Tax=Hexamita inflata TaxID=28002 RepID=A0AA86U9U6_9EUKA|nr:Alkaline phosphatase [Hexamita inflata]CAI9946839.1 Alkaline phosphatase [Hexamita inflata]
MNMIITEVSSQQQKLRHRKMLGSLIIAIIIICITVIGSVLLGYFLYQQPKQTQNQQMMSVSQSELCYGPLAFMHEQGTRIHWCTKEKVESQLVGYPSSANTKSHYHSTFVNSTNFNYSLPGSDVQYSYYLPETIKNFVVMTDTHGNPKYTNLLNEIDFDFMFHNGDMCENGDLSELEVGFANWPVKPMLFATGNHDYNFNKFNHVIERPLHYYQQIRNIGVFVIYTLNNEDKDAFSFLNDNAHLAEDSDHVFIVTHNPTYATGGHGAISKLSKKMEKFLDTHSYLNFRSVFSGHNHVFTAFKRNDLFYFVNGVGGGHLNDVYSKQKMGARVWKTEELHGPLEEVDDQSYGYQYHLDSYSKYTRTEVSFEGNKIRYVIRDLDTNTILRTYEQTF